MAAVVTTIRQRIHWFLYAGWWGFWSDYIRYLPLPERGRAWLRRHIISP